MKSNEPRKNNVVTYGPAPAGYPSPGGDGRMAVKPCTAQYYYRGMDWTELPVGYLPCPHVHFRSDLINRDRLERQDHIALLATPRGYRWIGSADMKQPQPFSLARPPKKRLALQSKKAFSAPEQKYIHEFLGDIWNVMSPEMIDSLKKTLVDEFGMSMREAEKFIESQSEELKKSKKKGCIVDMDIRSHWLKQFRRLVAARLTDYIVSTMCTRRSSRSRLIAEEVLRHICDLTGESCTLNNPQSRVQRLQVFVADRIAAWLSQAVAEADKEMCEELQQKKEDDGKGGGPQKKDKPGKRPTKPKRKPKPKPKPGTGAAEKETAEAGGGKPASKPGSQPSSKPGSQPPSKPGSQPSSKPGSQPSSKPGSQPSSKPGSQAPSKPGSQPPSKPGSQPSSKPGSQAPSKPGSQPPSKPGSQAPSKPGSQPPSKPGSQPPSKPGSQPPSKPGSKPPSKPGSKPSSKPPSKGPSKPPSKPGSAPPSKPGTQPSSKPGTAPTSKPGSPRPESPTKEETVPETEGGTVEPTEGGTVEPTEGGTVEPTEGDTVEPTEGGTVEPTEGGTVEPTEGATTEPTEGATTEPTEVQGPGEEVEQKPEEGEKTGSATELETEPKVQTAEEKEVEEIVPPVEGGATGEPILAEEGVTGKPGEEPDAFGAIEKDIQETEPEKTPTQEAISEAIGDAVPKEIASDVDKETLQESVDKTATYVDKLITEAGKLVPVEIPPPVSGDVAFHIKKSGDGCYYDIKRVGRDEVCKGTAMARLGPSTPVFNAEVCRRPPDLNPMDAKKGDLREWAKWAANTVHFAEKWVRWIDSTVREAEVKAKEAQRGDKIWEEEYKRWKQEKEDNALEWRRNQKFIKETEILWKEKIGKLKKPPSL